MDLKNWTVIAKPIKDQNKGLARYLNYLTNPHHQNHKGKTQIKPLFGNIDDLYKRVTLAAAERDFQRAKKRKGGRAISSFAQSFVFTLPENIPAHPEKSDWVYFSKEILNTIISFTGVSADEIKKNVFINIHDQKNPHLNIVVSKILNNTVKTELQKKSIISALKKTFNYAVLKQLKISPSDYKPVTKRAKRYNSDYYSKNKLLIREMTKNEHYTEKDICVPATPVIKPTKQKAMKGLRP